MTCVSLSFISECHAQNLQLTICKSVEFLDAPMRLPKFLVAQSKLSVCILYRHLIAVIEKNKIVKNIKKYRTFANYGIPKL